LMLAQQREKMTELQEIQAINERRQSDPAGLARAMGVTEDLVKTMDGRTLRDIAKQVTIKRASVSPAQQAAQARLAQIMGIGGPPSAGGTAPAAGAPMEAAQAQEAADIAGWEGAQPQPAAAPVGGAAAAPVAPAVGATGGQMTPAMARAIASDPIILAGNPDLAKKYAEIAKELEPPGAKEAQVLAARREAERQVNMPKMEMSVSNRIAQTKDSLALIDTIISRANALTTGPLGWASREIPGTPAFNLVQDINSLKSRLGLDELRLLKDAGGTLGQVSNFELQALQSGIAGVDTAQSTEQFIRNLKKIQNVMQRSTSLYINAFEKDYKRRPDVEGYLRSREDFLQGGLPPAAAGATPPPGAAAPQAGGGQQLRSDPAALSQARAAIARGANREAIRQRLRQNGISDEGL